MTSVSLSDLDSYENPTLREAVDQMIKDRKILELTDDSFEIPTANNSWQIKISKADYDYLINQGLVTLMEELETDERLIRLFCDLSKEPRVHTEKLCQKIYDYLLNKLISAEIENEIPTEWEDCFWEWIQLFRGNEFKPKLSDIKQLYEIIKKDLWGQHNSGALYSCHLDMVAKLYKLSESQIYEEELVDEIYRHFRDMINMEVDSYHERCYRFRAYFSAIAGLTNISDLFAISLYNHGFLDLLHKISYIYSGGDHIGVLWNFVSIIISFGRFEQCRDDKWLDIVDTILRREGEEFGDYDDRQNFPVIIEDLKEIYYLDDDKFKQPPIEVKKIVEAKTSDSKQKFHTNFNSEQLETLIEQFFQSKLITTTKLLRDQENTYHYYLSEVEEHKKSLKKINEKNFTDFLVCLKCKMFYDQEFSEDDPDLCQECYVPE